MQRIEAIKDIMNLVTNEIVVSSCGRISREVFYVKDRPLNFYVMGSMGASLGIGIGLSLSKPNSKVIVIAGDGEILMELGTLTLLKWLQQRKKVNIDLYILDNNKYQSTGGQPTCSNAIDFRLLCDCKVIFCKDSEIDVPRISLAHEEITERFVNELKKNN